MHKLFDPIAEREYAACVADLLNSDEVLWMKNIRHHHFVTCYEHSLFVSYVAYRLARHWNIDAREAARAGLLHDLFLYDPRDKTQYEGNQCFAHPVAALKNASRLTELSEAEADAIVTHMWPLAKKMPRYKVSCGKHGRQTVCGDRGRLPVPADEAGPADAAHLCLTGR